MQPPRLTRRSAIICGIGGFAALIAGGFELIDHGVLPGQHELDELDGACSAPVPKETFRSKGPTITGRFHSRARRRDVGYEIAYPPGHGPGSRLPLALYLYADGGNQTARLGALTPAEALAGNGIEAMAIVTCDGGPDLYWNPHPGDDPMGMLIDEVIPMCQQRGLGVKPGQTGAIGVSMGGYGALLLAEKHPSRIAAVAAISPAIWTSYGEAQHVNPAAYASAAAFARADALTHADALHGIPVRIASGTDDPFHNAAVQLAQRLDGDVSVDFGGGCHDTNYFTSQQQESLRFLATHLNA